MIETHDYIRARGVSACPNAHPVDHCVERSTISGILGSLLPIASPSVLTPRWVEISD